MINRHQKYNVFKALYHICEERNINFYTNTNTNIIHTLFLRKGWEKYMDEFIKFYEHRKNLNKNILILHESVNMHNIDFYHNTIIKKKDIYGGFIYLNIQSYKLVDKSLLSIMNKIKHQFKTTRGEL